MTLKEVIRNYAEHTVINEDEYKRLLEKVWDYMTNNKYFGLPAMKENDND